MQKIFLCGLVVLSLVACQNQKETKQTRAINVNVNTNQWNDYWYAGDAEISVFELEQVRYSEVHAGHSVLIFVTEDFLTDIQVKNETYQNTNSTSVLKTNILHKFPTGLYDYSLMTSVFTPVDRQTFPHTLKVTTSAQDWCGQSYSQLNYTKNKYHYHLFSYFEGEGDQQNSISSTLLEDELLNLIRLDPTQIPTGEIEIIPSSAFARLKHIEVKSYPAQLKLDTYQGSDFVGDQLQVLTLVYPTLDRELEIAFDGTFPHQIAGWTDSYKAVISGKKLKTVAKRKSLKKLPYWSKHDLEHLPLREEMRLPEIN